MQRTLTREGKKEEIKAQCVVVYRQQITDLAEHLQRSEQKVIELEMKNKQLAQDLDRLVILLDCALFKNTMYYI